MVLDFDEKAADTFKMNMPQAEVLVGDITDASVKQKVIGLSKKAGINMIIGGPPCQDHSMKGKKPGLKDPRNFLFREYLNLVKELKPEIFVIENVKGLLLASNGWFKEEILKAIEELGYVVEYGVLNAADFGVPQAGERAIFICSKRNKISLPKSGNEKHTTVSDAISDLSYLESGEGDFEQDYSTEAMSEYQKLMRKGSKKLYNHKASNHKWVAIEKLKLIPPEQGKEFLPSEMHGNQKFRISMFCDNTYFRFGLSDITDKIVVSDCPLR